MRRGAESHSVPRGQPARNRGGVSRARGSRVACAFSVLPPESGPVPAGPGRRPPSRTSARVA
eukprot:3940392-Rhodomonas_salina.2